MGGLGFSHPSEGDNRGEEVQCGPHGQLVTSTSPALFLLLLFVCAFIGTQLQAGNGVGAPRGQWREGLPDPGLSTTSSIS